MNRNLNFINSYLLDIEHLIKSIGGSIIILLGFKVGISSIKNIAGLAVPETAE